MGEDSNKYRNGLDQEESIDGSIEVLPPNMIKYKLWNMLKKHIN